MENRYTFKKFFNDIHLWLGIASGLILFIVCLSGTVYTFRAEIERLTSPSKYYVTVAPGQELISPDSLIARFEKQLNGKVLSIQMPLDKERSWQVGLRKNEQTGTQKGGGNQPDKGAEGGARPKIYFVNPYTATILGEEGNGVSDFFTATMQLHRWLLMDRRTGGLIVGIATLVFLGLIISGLIIWFPARLKHWKQGLKITFRGNWKRTNHDLHNTLGFYAGFFLLIMASTGLCWSFEWYRNGASALLGARVFAGRNEKPLQSAVSETSPQPVSALLQQADAAFPYPGDYRIMMASDAAGSVSISKNKTGFFALSAADRIVLDQYTGKPLKTDRFSSKKWNKQIAALVKPMHTGEIFGTFSKIIYFIACLFATSLPVTGTIIWLNKLKKKRNRRKDKGPYARKPFQSYKAELELH